MADITQKISNFPTAPNSKTDTPQEFNSKADAFVHHQADTYVTEVNTWATQANALEGTMNQIKTDIDNITGAIPSGTIDDGSTGATKVWSSNKVSERTKIFDTDSNGTTSEVVGTGFIIAGGINANGRWIKYADGTLLQYMQVTTSSSADAHAPFPTPFSANDFSVVGTARTSFSGAVAIVFTLGDHTGVGVNAFKTDNSRLAVGVGMVATGRWK